MITVDLRDWQCAARVRTIDRAAGTHVITFPLRQHRVHVRAGALRGAMTQPWSGHSPYSVPGHAWHMAIGHAQRDLCAAGYTVIGVADQLHVSRTAQATEGGNGRA